MAKTNFTKVEEALTEGMLKMTKGHLLSLADSIAGLKGADAAAQKKLIAKLKIELNWMEKQDAALHKKLGITKAEIKQLIEKKEALNQEDLEKIQALKSKIDTLKDELNKTHPPKSDEELVNNERAKHINKRFNTNDDWLPLH